MKQELIVYWARRDFRLHDNPALTQAIEFSKRNDVPFLPMYIIDKGYIEDPKQNISYPRRYFLYNVVQSFAGEFEKFAIGIGSPETVFDELSQKYSLKLYCNDDIEPFSRLRDKQIKDCVENNGGEFFRVAEIMSVSLETRSQSNTIYTVFTPFKNAVWKEFIGNEPLDRVDLGGADYAANDSISDLKHMFRYSKSSFRSELSWLTSPDWKVYYPTSNNDSLDLLAIHNDTPDLSEWKTDENSVLVDASNYIRHHIPDYNQNRNDLGKDMTSKMSYALKWGIISARTLRQKVGQEYDIEADSGAQSYISELIWREFYKYVLYHYPHVLDTEYLEKRRNLDWIQGGEAKRRFESWVSGTTGFEVVDSAMKQIAKTGWMHNRSRMITASVLTKNLGVDWRWGQAYFRAALVDLDEASNNGGWQWSASVGVDPKPIRIFNPFTQKDKFDPVDTYSQKWLKSPVSQTIVDYKSSRHEALRRYGLE